MMPVLNELSLSLIPTNTESVESDGIEVHFMFSSGVIGWKGRCGRPVYTLFTTTVTGCTLF